MLGNDWTSIGHASFGRVMNLKENTGLLNGASSVDQKTKGVLVLRILKSRTDADRKSVVSGKSVRPCVDLVGRRRIKKKKHHKLCKRSGSNLPQTERKQYVTNAPLQSMYCSHVNSMADIIF